MCVLPSDFVGIALVSAAVVGAGVVAWRRGGRGLCGGCGYDLKGLPTELECCPECGRARAKRRSRWRRFGSLKFVGLAAVALVGAGVLVWPRREAVMDRMPSSVLLLAERLGYARGLEIVTLRAHAGEMGSWQEQVFVDRVTERMMEDSDAVTWPRSNALYVYTQFALVGVVDAREGLQRMFRLKNVPIVDDIVKTLAFIRMDSPLAMVTEAREHNQTAADFLKTDRGKLYPLLMEELAWLADTLLEVLGAAKSDNEAVGTIVLMKQLFGEIAVGERVAARLEGGKWATAQAYAKAWVEQLKAPRYIDDYWAPSSVVPRFTDAP